MRVVFWRHGQTRWNVEGRMQGSVDIPLDEKGRAQARSAARLLAALGPTAIVTSDLSRASATAAELSALTGLRPTLDPRLRERSMGEWEGLTHEEIQTKHGGVWPPSGGESDAVVAGRVSAAVLDAVRALPEDGEPTLVAASHGAAIRLGLAALLGLPEPAWGALGPMGNCAWSIVCGSVGRGSVVRGSLGGPGAGWPPAWRLLEYNAGTLPAAVASDDE